MALAGVGVDMVNISRMERILGRTPRFAQRVFTAEERAYCDRTARPTAHYACRFAAREAVLKALGCGFSKGVSWADVSVTQDGRGRPQAVLKGRAAQIAREQGVLDVAISMSVTRDMAVANAVATTAQTGPKQPDDPDPKRELEASFRQARALIDELDRAKDGK